MSSVFLSFSVSFYNWRARSRFLLVRSSSWANCFRSLSIRYLSALARSNCSVRLRTRSSFWSICDCSYDSSERSFYSKPRASSALSFLFFSVILASDFASCDSLLLRMLHSDSNLPALSFISASLLWSSFYLLIAASRFSRVKLTVRLRLSTSFLAFSTCFGPSLDLS